MPIEPGEVVQLLSRSDTLANWTAADPVPGLGGWCVEFTEDPAKPGSGLPDPLTDTVKVKIGTGLHHYSDLPYWTGGGGGGGGSDLSNIGPNTIIGRNLNTAGAYLELSTSQVLGMLGVPTQGALDAVNQAVTGHLAKGASLTVSVTATSTNGSATVTTTGGTTFPAEFDVHTPISGPGIPAHTYIGVRNSNTSIGLSSSSTSNVPVTATNSSPFGAAGAGSFTVRNVWDLPHSMAPVSVLQQNPQTGAITGYSFPNNLGVGALQPDQWRIQWKDGIRYARSYENDQANGGSATWVKEFPPDLYTPEFVYSMVPVNNAWASPADGQEFLNQARWRLLIPFFGFSQAKIVIDQTITAATGMTSFKFKLQYATDGLTGAAWADLAAAASAVEVDATGSGTHNGTYGNIHANAIAQAATNGGWLLVTLRAVIVGTVGNTPNWGTIRSWFK